MSKDSSKELLGKLTELSALCFQYGETYRFTTYPDGQTRESDTDHTFMLGMSACVLRDICAPELDRGRLAEYALIHDFVEVYAGDTATLGTTYSKEDKIKREEEALKRIKREYDQTFRWIGEAIQKYESQEEPEARFIKVLDKVMPGLTQAQNNGEMFARLGVPATDIAEGKEKQLTWIKEAAKEWPLLIELYKASLNRVYALPYFKDLPESSRIHL